MTIFGTLWPKQNNLVIWLRHNGGNKHLATPLSMYFLDMLVMDLFPIYFTQNHYFCFYFLTLPFYFVPSLGKEALLGHGWRTESAMWPRLGSTDWVAYIPENYDGEFHLHLSHQSVFISFTHFVLGEDETCSYDYLDFRVTALSQT